MIHDDVGRHLSAAGSFDRAAVPLGIYVAWCANLQLLSRQIADEAAALVMRVRFREITGSELVVAGCGGVLADEHLTAEGQAFTRHYYRRYLEVFTAELGADLSAVKDDWAAYERLAKDLTRELMAFREHGGGDGARGKRPSPRPWWRPW